MNLIPKIPHIYTQNDRSYRQPREPPEDQMRYQQVQVMKQMHRNPTEVVVSTVH